MAQSGKNADGGKIAAHIEAALSSSIGAMAAKEFTVVLEADESLAGEFEEPIVWQQAFSHSADPSLWLSAGKDLWGAAGQMTLAAVGIDSPTDEDCRSTWQEILGQTMGAFASSLTADAQQEINTSKGEETEAPPDDLNWVVFAVRTDDETTWYVKAAWNATVTALYEQPEPVRKPVVDRDTSFSKTFDLLLDVALPVSVSFGKTHLQIREVLKLNTGSIVELNRFVVEPVDVIVNDCVIARGEVVVVDGNYGVRVTQLASREDRLRSGMAETTAKVGAGAR